MTTDIIVIIAMIFLTVRGWSVGLTRTLIGPVSLALSIVAGIIYFNSTKNLIHAGLITIFGPIVFSVVISLTLFLWRKTTDQEKPSVVRSIGGLAGSICNICWGGFIIAISLIFIAILPEKLTKLTSLKENVVNSRSYSILNSLMKDRVPYVKNVENLFEAMENPDKMEQIRSTPEYNTVYKDKKIQDILSDDKTMEQIKNKDFIKLMSNPKLQSVLNDEDLVQDMLKLYSEKDTKSTYEPPPPKVYEVDGDKITIIQ